MAALDYSHHWFGYFYKIMDKINEYYQKVVTWVEKNPGKATLVGIFAAGLLIGIVLF